MKLIIDIPKNIYKDIMTHNREGCEGGKSAYYFEGVIQNGTPLDMIRDDIEKYIDKEKLRFGGQFDSGLNLALKIIDKFSESEG